MGALGVNDSEAIYRIAHAWASSARSGVSAFDASCQVWTPQASQDLLRRMVDTPDESGRSFAEKLPEQMAGADRATALLLADLVLLHLLGPRDIGGKAKRQLLEDTLQVVPGAEIAVPDEIAEALDHGLFNGRPAFTQSRYWLIAFLIRMADALTGLTNANRDRFFTDPGF